jgi:voltage-gated potassium channel
MGWRDWTSGDAAVLLSFAVAVLSVVTGIANIGTTTVAFGPVSAYVPEFVRTTAGFTGTLTGFLMLLSAFGLRRGLRAAWTSTMVLLPVTAAQGLLQSSGLSIPLLGLSVVTLLVLGVNRRRFDREMDLSATQLASILAIAGAQIYGTAGAYALREQFSGMDSLTDAFYFALVTGSTVGYGDITPQTDVARLFGMSALLVTVSSFAVALGVLLTPAIEARLTNALGRMTETQLDLLEDHVLVLGYGDLTEPILEELGLKSADFLVVTPDADTARRLSERDIDVLTADPSDEETLRRASVEDARAVVVATVNDAEDALAILTARQLNPEVRIVAAANQTENVRKLKRAGANTVISPATIGGKLLVRSALGDAGTEEAAEELVQEDDSYMQE